MIHPQNDDILYMNYYKKEVYFMEDFVNNFVNIIYVIIDAIRSLVESLRGPRLTDPTPKPDDGETPAEGTN